MESMREVQLERQLERQQEEEEDVVTRRQRYENQIQNATTLQEIEILMMERFKNDNSKLRVYIDRDNQKYYIDTFAAYSLGLLSYGKAAGRFDYGMTLYEISSEMLNMLERVFQGRIEYQYLPSKKNADPEVDFSDNYSDIIQKYNDYKKIAPDNYKIDNHRNIEDELSKIFNPYHSDLVDFKPDIDLEDHKYNR